MGPTDQTEIKPKPTIADDLTNLGPAIGARLLKGINKWDRLGFVLNDEPYFISKSLSSGYIEVRKKSTGEVLKLKVTVEQDVS